MKRTLLIYTNSLNDKSETFIINHIRFCATYFQITVLVNDPTIKIPEDLSLEVFSTELWKGFTHRMKVGLSSIMTGKLSNLKFINPIKFGRNAFNFSLVTIAPFFFKNNFDIVHSHFGNNGLLISQLKKAGLIRSLLYTQFHGLDFTSKKYHGDYYKDLITYTDKVIVVTNFSLQNLINLGFQKEKILHIPVGTDLNFFRPFKVDGHSDNIKKIVFIGRLMELKGVKLLPDLVELLIRSYKENFVFYIVGEGPLDFFLRDNLKGYNDVCQILGYQNKCQIREILNNSDVFVYPGIVDSDGRVENQCVSLQEALAMKVPVVAFNVGGISDSIQNEVTGFLIEQGDLKEMSDRIISLLINSKLKNELGLNGLKLVEQNYSLKKNMKLLLDSYSI